MVKRNFLTKMLLLCALIVGSVSSAWGQKTNVSTVTTKFSANGNVTSNFAQTGDYTNATWYLAVTWKDNASWQNMADKGAQIGSGSHPATKIVLTGASVPGTITSVKVNTSVASGGTTTVGVEVGGVTFKCNNANTATLQTSAADYTFSGTSSGDVVLTWNQASTSKAIYIKSITVTYEETSATDPSATLSTTSLDFGKVNFGETKALTFTVTPANLTGDLSLSCNNAKYEVSPTSIASMVTTATTITVTAKPTALNDNMDGTVTISGGGLAANKTVTLTTTVTDPDANDGSSIEKAYTVAEAIAATPASGTSDNVYIKGIVSSFQASDIVSDGLNYRYYISDDGTETNQLLVYKGKGLNEATFTDAGDLLLGDEVVIYGGLTTYNDTKEVAANNYIVSLIRPEKPKHNVTFSINGIAGEPVEVEEDAAIIFPEVTAPEGYTFLGWTTAEISGEQASAPTDLLTEATMGTADITYYAVFAIVNGSFETATLTASHTTNSTTYDNHTYTDDKDNTWSGNTNEPYENNVARIGLRNTSGSYLESPTFSGNVTEIKIMTFNGSSSNRTFNINSTKDNSTADLGTVTAPANTKLTEEQTAVLTGTKFNKFFIVPTGAVGFSYIKVTYGNQTVSNYCTTVPTGVTVTIASSGYTTLSSAHGLDFANATAEEADALIAYIIPSNNGVKLTKTEVTEAAAGTGILLKGTPGATYTIPVKSGAAAVGKNLLKAGPKDVEEDNTTIYLLKSGKFHLASAGTTSVGKAYLELHEAVGAPALSIDGDDETTGINLTTVNGQKATDGVYYDLSGRRVAQPTKGVFIVNGKKVVIK